MKEASKLRQLTKTNKINRAHKKYNSDNKLYRILEETSFEETKTDQTQN